MIDAQGTTSNLKTVLLIEPETSTAKSILKTLASAGSGLFQVTWATDPVDASRRLVSERIDMVLTGPTLPRSAYAQLCRHIDTEAPNVHILALKPLGAGYAKPIRIRQGGREGPGDAHADTSWLPRVVESILARKAAQDTLDRTEARLLAISEASPLGIFISDADGNCTYTNAAFQRISGRSSEETVGSGWVMAIHPDDRERIALRWAEASSTHIAVQAEARFLRPDAVTIWTRVSATPIRSAGALHGYVQTVEDISELKATDQALRTAEEAFFHERERARVTLDSIGDAVLSTDLQGNVTYMNTVAEEITDWSSADALGRPLIEVFNIIDGQTGNTAINPAQRAIAENKIVGLSLDSRLIRRNGTETAIEDSAAPIHDRDGKISGAVIVFRDADQSHTRALEMTHRAQHDGLTGLPNRALLLERLWQTIGQAQRHKRQVGLLFIDLDNFKLINDSKGHAIGDEVLQAIAKRLQNVVRATDTVCRQGGDEFVILLAEIEQPLDAARIAENIRIALSQPHMIDGDSLYVTSSIGISIYPDDGADASTLLQHADAAMYKAKACGRNTCKRFIDSTPKDSHDEHPAQNPEQRLTVRTSGMNAS